MQADSNAAALADVHNLQFVAGEGVEGDIDGARTRLGSKAFVQALVGHTHSEVKPGATLFLGRANAWLASFELSDPLKADASATLRALQRRALTAHLLSGDRADRVEQVAGLLGIDRARVRGGASPADKLDYARALAQSGARWIAVGDGVNDAPLMAAADVSIAMGTGADLTRLTADAVLLSPNLQPLLTAHIVSRKMIRIIHQNFAWAIAYNVIAIPLAVSGQVSPAVAAIGMALSSLAVVANSMRLMLRKANS
jgi:Cu2+-exporting ATPase